MRRADAGGAGGGEAGCCGAAADPQRETPRTLSVRALSLVSLLSVCVRAVESMSYARAARGAAPAPRCALVCVYTDHTPYRYRTVPYIPYIRLVCTYPLRYDTAFKSILH